MKLYEIHIVLRPTLGEGDVTKFVTEMGEALATSGFSITASQNRPNEYLTYPIKHFKQGHFLNIEISGADETIFPTEVDSKLRHSENVLRYIIFSRSEKELKRAKPFPIFGEPRTPFRHDRKIPIASEFSTMPDVETKVEMPKMDIEEVDKKLEEILK